MKNLFIMGLLIFYFSITLQVSAQNIETELTLFKKVENTDFILLNMSIKNPDNSNIEYWKVKGYCEDNINIYLKNAVDYNCKKSIRISNENKEPLFFLIHNKDKANRLSIKLRAYDKEGKRVYNKKELFLW